MKHHTVNAPNRSKADSTEAERITRLEEGQYSLQSTVQRLAELQADQAEMQAREHAATRKEIGSLAERFSNSGKPNFSVIIAACSFVMVLGGAVLSPLYWQLTENKNNLASLTDNFHKHETIPSHPVATAVMEEREKALTAENKLRDELQQARIKLLEQQISRK